MNGRFTKLTLLSITVAGMGLTACGPGEKEGDAQPIEHSTARQAIVGNSQEVAARISANIGFLEQSRLFADAIQLTAADEVAPCADFDTCPEPEPAQVEIDTDINDEVDEALAELEARILNDASVEAQTETSITYLVDGEQFCASEGTSDPECVSQVDQAEIRLVVTSPSEGDVDIDLLIGPDRANPGSLSLTPVSLDVRVDLAGVRASADHIAGVVGEEIELPTTFEGELGAGVRAEGDEVAVSASATGVNVSDGDFSIAGGFVWNLIANGADKTLTAESSTTLDADFPITSYTYDVDTGTDIEETYRMGLHVAGANGTVTLDTTNEVVTATGIQLAEAATMSVDGVEVMALDLNANDGRSLDATIAAEGDATTIEVSPVFDLTMAMNFEAAAAAYGETDEWMANEVLHIRLDGATAPKVSVGDQLEVLAGQLMMELENAGESMTVTEGQCLLEVSVDAAGGTDTEPVEVDTGLFADLEAGTCQ